jgi:hypothetical protein
MIYKVNLILLDFAIPACFCVVCGHCCEMKVLFFKGSLCRPGYLLVIIHSVPSCNHGSNHYSLFPYCNVDIFVTERKLEIDERSKNNDSIESQSLESAIVSVPACDVSSSSVDSSTSKLKVPQKVKADKAKYSYYNESYMKYGFFSNLCDPPPPLCVICNQILSSNSLYFTDT